MTNIESFMNTWEVNSKPLPNKLLRQFNNLEIGMSISGRTNTVRLNHLKSLKKNEGYATKFIKWLVKEADKNNFHVTVCAQPFGPYYLDGDNLDKELLKTWFEKYGFEVKFLYPDNAGYEMERWYKEK